MRVISGYRSALLVAVAILGSAFGAGAQQGQPNPITLFIGEGTGNRGDTALISVELGVGNTRPASMVVWLRYNTAKIRPNSNAFEFTVVDLEGNPIRDSQGNTFTSRGPVRREQSLLDAEKQIDVEVHAEGAMGIAIQGLNGIGIAPGPLLTLAFTVQPGVIDAEVVPLEGAEESDPVQFDNGGDLVTAWSSASYEADSGATLDLGIELSDGRVVVACTQPLAAGSVTATNNQPDAVVVNWTASSTLGAQYRVYRSETNNVSAALPLGTGPQSGTTFTDFTALAPAVPSAGCACNATATPVRYFYWVRTLSASDCEGPFTTVAVEGSRSSAKVASATASTVIDTFPTSADDPASNQAQSGDTVAVRLEGVATGSAWAGLSAGDVGGSAFRWMADGENSGWAGVVLPETLAEGSVVLLTAGATATDGSAVGPVVREFVVRGAAKAKGAASLADIGLDAVPFLSEGVGTVFNLGGDDLFATPTVVELPVSSDAQADELQLYTYVAVQGDRRWYLASKVSGLVAEAPTVLTRGGATFVRVTLRHGATLQLGTAPAPEHTVQAASVAPAIPTGDLLLLGGVAVSLLAFRAKRRRA